MAGDFNLYGGLHVEQHTTLLIYLSASQYPDGKLVKHMSERGDSSTHPNSKGDAAAIACGR